MSGPLDSFANKRDTLVTRALITAIGKALVKQGALATTDVAHELHTMSKGLSADPELQAEMINMGNIVLGWNS